MAIFGDTAQALFDGQKAKLDAMLASGQITQAQYDDAMRVLTAVTQAEQTGGPSPGVLPGPSAVSLDKGGMYGKNGQLAAADPNSYKTLQMHLAALGANAYRPEMAQARAGALENTLSAYTPMNNVMGAMYGPGAQMDFHKMSQSPLSQAMMQIGAPNTGDIGLKDPTAPGGPASYMGPGPTGPAAATAPVSYPSNPIVVPPAPSPPQGLHRGPDGKMYDAQGKLVG
jgi:hypothetical protein